MHRDNMAKLAYAAGVLQAMEVETRGSFRHTSTVQALEYVVDVWKSETHAAISESQESFNAIQRLEETLEEVPDGQA